MKNEPGKESRLLVAALKLPDTSVTMDGNGVRLYYEDTEKDKEKWMVITRDKGRIVEQYSGDSLLMAVMIFIKLVTRNNP